MLGVVWSFWPQRATGSDADQYSATTGFLLSVAVCALCPAPGVLRDLSPSGGSCPRDCPALCPAVPLWHRREEPAPTARRRVERHDAVAGSGSAGVSGYLLTVVTPDGCLERSANSSRI